MCGAGGGGGCLHRAGAALGGLDVVGCKFFSGKLAAGVESSPQCYRNCKFVFAVLHNKFHMCFQRGG